MARIDVFGLTDVGKKRKHNEDAFALEEVEGFFVVADGMGGHAAGEVAAKITVETIGEFIAATRQKEEATWPFKYNHELHFNSNRPRRGDREGQRARDGGGRGPALAQGHGDDGRRGPAQRQERFPRARGRQPGVPLPRRAS